MENVETQASEAAEIAKEEVFTFVLQEHVVKTIDGTEKALKRCSWGKEMQIMEALKEILHDIATSGIFGNRDEDVSQGEAIFKLLSTVFGRCPHALTKIVASLVEENDQWVKDNLDMEEMLKLVIPFLYGMSQKLGGVLTQYQEQLRGAANRILN